MTSPALGTLASGQDAVADSCVMNEPTNPEDPQLSLFLEHRIEEIERTSHAVNAFCAEHEIADRDHSAIQVVIDELLMNVVSYAFPNDTPDDAAAGALEDATQSMPIADDSTAEMPISVPSRESSDSPKVLFELTLVPGHLHVTIVDNGKAFDPFSLDTPDTEAHMDDRPIGGLGVHLVRKLMDKCFYERSEGRNILKLSRRLLEDDSPSAENWSIVNESPEPE